jgi:tRNA nucleotidyltransferase (CCA-adding enzyme)
MHTPKYIHKFAEIIDLLFGGKVYVVGGAVRDYFMGYTPKDYDLEVWGVPEPDLINIPNVHVQEAGHRFGVWIVDFEGETFEVALPQDRVSSPDGDRSKEWAEINPWLPIEQSLLRRDYTMNAIAFDVQTGEFIDPLGGQEDIEWGILSAVNIRNFADDPLRVLRGFQFCSRFDLVANEYTLMAAQQTDWFDQLSTDRIRNEWDKWAKGAYPHRGIEFLRDTGWIKHFPVLADLELLPQDPIHHPEGDVLTHTILALSECRVDDPIVKYAVLLHDIGKPEALQVDLSTPRHDQMGAGLVPEFFRSIGREWENSLPNDITQVQSLVGEHMWMMSFRLPPSDIAIRRLAVRLQPASVEQWAQVCLADINGRDIKDVQADSENIVDVYERARHMEVEQDAPQNIVMGRHLIDAGIIEPGPEMGNLIRVLYRMQVDGIFSTLEDGLEYAWKIANE